MKIQSGFAPVLLVIVAGVLLTVGIGGFSYLSESKQKSQSAIQIKEEHIPSFPLPTESLTPTIKPVVYVKPTATPSTTSVYVVINDNNGNRILDNNLWLHFRNENTQEEKLLQNKTSDWKITDVTPGKYKITIPFSYKNYFNPARNCEGCRDKEDKSDFEICGYVVNLAAGDNVRISCTLGITHPLEFGSTNSITSGPDTIPPNTNIYYPQPNGSITYKIDGKVCAIASEPSDNQGSNGIETEYKFDNLAWSGWAGGRGYICTDSLSNGPHTLSYHSKDKAGNVEATKTISFTVNIPGN